MSLKKVTLLSQMQKNHLKPNRRPHKTLPRLPQLLKAGPLASPAEAAGAVIAQGRRLGPCPWAEGRVSGRSGFERSGFDFWFRIFALCSEKDEAGGEERRGEGEGGFPHTLRLQKRSEKGLHPGGDSPRSPGATPSDSEGGQSPQSRLPGGGVAGRQLRRGHRSATGPSCPPSAPLLPCARGRRDRVAVCHTPAGELGTGDLPGTREAQPGTVSAPVTGRHGLWAGAWPPGPQPPPRLLQRHRDWLDARPQRGRSDPQSHSCYVH